MNCWHCKTELIWGGDSDGEDIYNDENVIISNLTCPSCDAYHEVSWNFSKEER